VTPCELILGTADGIRRVHVDRGGNLEVTARGLTGNAVRGIAIHPHDPDVLYVAAGLRGWGLHRSLDGGETFDALGFEEYWCWDVVLDPANPERLLVGTEPPMLWESTDSGESWRSFPGIDHVESRKTWTFFHPPFHAGHLHGIALDSRRPDRIVVGVEHGGLLLSQDAGNTWRDVMPGADLHRVVIDPVDADLIFAGAGNGLFRSPDGGQHWSAVEQLHGRYIHGIVIDPDDPLRMFVYVDSQHCPVYRTIDGGETWEPIGRGLPASRPADPLRMHPDEGTALFYAGDKKDGSILYLSNDNGESWCQSDLHLPKVWRLATVVR
jgi:photosystem II stability/assembly factor-like uncharacterized protein